MIARKHKLVPIKDLPKLRIGDNYLDWVDCFNYLGFSIDQTRSFNSAIELMHRKAAYKLKTLYMVRGNLTPHSGLCMAKSMIHVWLNPWPLRMEQTAF